MTRAKKRDVRKEATDQALRILPGALKAARQRAGLTQADVGRSAHIASEVYGRMERGGLLPSLPVFLLLCEVLEVEPNELLGRASMEGSALRPEGAMASLLAQLPDSIDMRRLLRRMSRATPREFRILREVSALFIRGRSE